MLRLFGTPHVSGLDGLPMRLPAKSYLAAALLDLKFAGVVERHVLAAELWENSSAVLANRSLRQMLVLVRNWESEFGRQIFSIGPRSIARGAAELRSDVSEFMDIKRIETGAELARLSSLYAGDFLLGLVDVSGDIHEWMASQRVRLRDRFVHLALEAAERLGGQEADDVLHRLAEESPYDDTIQRALMVHLARERSTGAVRSAYGVANRGPGMTTTVPRS